jgi:hypothetical protein
VLTNSSREAQVVGITLKLEHLHSIKTSNIIQKHMVVDRRIHEIREVAKNRAESVITTVRTTC